MRRYLLFSLVIAAAGSIAGAYFFYNYWVHRYDELIARQAGVYRLDERLVRSVIHEETFFLSLIHI